MAKNNTKKRFHKDMKKKETSNAVKKTENKKDEEKNNKNNVSQFEEIYTNKKKFYSILLVILMFASSIGFIFVFALSYNPDNQNQDRTEILFQQFEQQGNIFWGAVRNSEEFIFQNITGFEEREGIEKIANEIKNNTKLNILVSEDFNSTDLNSIKFELEKSLRGLKIEYKTILLEEEIEKDTTTLYLTKLELLPENSILYPYETYEDIRILQYFLIK